MTVHSLDVDLFGPEFCILFDLGNVSKFPSLLWLFFKSDFATMNESRGDGFRRLRDSILTSGT
jgi:hypothetical protein